MEDFFLILALLASWMPFISLISPRIGLFFAHTSKRTRWRGFLFWWLPSICLCLFFVIAGNAKNGAPTSIWLWVFAFFLTAGCIATTQILREPLPASVASAVTIASHTTSGQNYTLNTAKLSCTCPDWRERRASMRKNSPMRICKHLAEYFGNRPALLPKALQPFAAIIKERGNAGRGLPVEGDDTEVEYGYREGQAFIIEFRQQDYPWVNILYAGGRYGFNLEEKRWAKGEEPDCKSFFMKKFEGEKYTQHIPPEFYLDELNMKELRTLAEALGVKAAKNKDDLLLGIEDTIGERDAYKKAEAIGLFERLRQKARKEEEREERQLREEEERDERQWREEEEREYKKEWQKGLAEFLNRKPQPKEEKAYAALLGDDYETRCANLSLFADDGKRCIRPKKEWQRQNYIQLAKMGVLLTSGDIPLPNRLEMQAMDDLRSLADGLGAQRASSKKGLIVNIMAMGEDKVSQAIQGTKIADDELYFSDRRRVIALANKETEQHSDLAAED